MTPTATSTATPCGALNVLNASTYGGETWDVSTESPWSLLWGHETEGGGAVEGGRKRIGWWEVEDPMPTDPIVGVTAYVRWKGDRPPGGNLLEFDYSVVGSILGLLSPDQGWLNALTGVYQVDSLVLNPAGGWTPDRLKDLRFMLKNGTDIITSPMIYVDHVYFVVTFQNCAGYSPTDTRTVSATPSTTRTRSPSPTVTRTLTPNGTRTSTTTETNTGTQTGSTLLTPSQTWTFTETLTPSPSVTATFTATKTGSEPQTGSSTSTASETLVPTGSGSATPSETAILTATRSSTSSSTHTLSQTRTQTRTPTGASVPLPSGTATPTSSPNSTGTTGATVPATFSVTNTLTPTSGRRPPLLLGANVFDPGMGPLKVRVWVPASGAHRLDVYTSVGEKVRSLSAWEGREGDSHILFWDGRVEEGTLVGSELYLILLRHPGGSEIKKVLVARGSGL